MSFHCERNVKYTDVVGLLGLMADFGNLGWIWLLACSSLWSETVNPTLAWIVREFFYNSSIRLCCCEISRKFVLEGFTYDFYHGAGFTLTYPIFRLYICSDETSKVHLFVIFCSSCFSYFYCFYFFVHMFFIYTRIERYCRTNIWTKTYQTYEQTFIKRSLLFSC